MHLFFIWKSYVLALLVADLNTITYTVYSDNTTPNIWTAVKTEVYFPDWIDVSEFGLRLELSLLNPPQMKTKELGYGLRSKSVDSHKEGEGCANLSKHFQVSRTVGGASSSSKASVPPRTNPAEAETKRIRISTLRNSERRCCELRITGKDLTESEEGRKKKKISVDLQWNRMSGC